MTNSFNYRFAMTREINPFVIDSTRTINPEFAKLNLEHLKIVLKDTTLGLSWSEEKCNRAEIQYKRFLHLQQKYPDTYFPIEVTNFMDFLHTYMYRIDCLAVTSESPWYMRSFHPYALTWHNNVTSFRSCKNYEQLFGYGHYEPIFTSKFKPWQKQIDRRKKEVRAKFQETKELYFKEFGEKLDLKKIC